MGRLKTNKERRRKQMEKNMKPGNKINIPMKGGVIAPGILPGVKPSDLTKVVCGNIIDGERCGHNLFIPISQLMHATRFQTATAQPTIVNFPGNWACAKCAALNNFHIPGVTDKEEPKPVEETSDGKTVQ